MEKFLDIAKDIYETLEKHESEDRQRMEAYESTLNEVLNKFLRKQPPEQSARDTKKPKISLRNEVEIDSGVDAMTEASSQESTRPSRSAKTKASANLKLPNLTTKLRQEIKMEPISEDSSSSANSTHSVSKESNVNSVAVKREKISVGIRNQKYSNGDTDTSIMVIPNEVNIITLSDDDTDDDKMPPPLKPAPKKLPARNTRQKSKVTENGNESDDVCSSSSVKLEKSETKDLKQKKTRTKRDKKIVKPMIEVKEETVDKEITREMEETKNAQSSQKLSQDKNDNQLSLNVSLESVYEDAKSSQPTKSLAVCSTYVCEPKGTKTVDETFVSKNSTFKDASNPQNGYNLNGPATEKAADGKTSKISNRTSSIITEDDSGDEMVLKDVRTKMQRNKELFNPCIQSPMQFKVAAFEKAQQLHSPALPVRQTRTKTRQLAKENSEDGMSKLPRPTTPSVELKHPNKQHTTPLTQSLVPKNVYAQNALRTQSSAAKLANFNRPNSAQPIRSRENSVEDLMRSKEEIRMEKKRKAEERIKRVQQLRETKEKEKQEKFFKAYQERREKEEAEKLIKAKKEQEKLQKQLKAQELKREKELRLKAELANAAKQERDIMLSQKILAEKELLNNMKQTKTHQSNLKYTFDMLLTDDSTDEEDKVSSHRPAPPAWSLRCNRKTNMIAQAGIDPSIIDKFFSCQPTTPDLAAIFPQIDSKHLKRNSSAVWNTPPRYSQLPKY